MGRLYKKLLYGVLIFLVVSTPLALGSVLPWAYRTIEALTYALVFLWAVRALGKKGFSYVKTPLLYFIPAFAALVLIQLIPLPASIIEAVSPARGIMRAAAGLSGGHDTLAVMPWGARDQGMFLMSVLLIFFLIINHIESEGRIKGIINTALFMAGLLVVFAFVEQALLQGRFLPYVNRNHFAGYMEIMLPFALTCILIEIFGFDRGYGIRETVLRAFSGKAGGRVVGMGILVVFMLAALLLTRSRGGVLGLIASLTVMGLIFGREKNRLPVFALAAALLIYLGISVAGEGYVLKFMGTLGNPSGDSATVVKVEIWKEALRIIKDSLITGVGLGGYEPVSATYKTSVANLTFQQPESDFLYVLAEAGIPGLAMMVCFGFMLLYIVVPACLKRRDLFARYVGIGAVCGFTALALHGLVDINLHMPANLLLITIVMALAFVAVHTSFRDGSRSGGLRLEKVRVLLDTPSKKAAVTAVAGLSLILAVVSAAGVTADVAYRLALRDCRKFCVSRNPDPGGADAITSRLAACSMLDPGRPVYGFEAGKVNLFMADYLARAVRDGKDKGLPAPDEYYNRALKGFNESLQDNPYSPLGRLLAGRTLARGLGNRTEGERELISAERLYPTNSYIRQYMDTYRHRPPVQADAPGKKPKASASESASASAQRPVLLKVVSVKTAGGNAGRVGDTVRFVAKVNSPDYGVEYKFMAWRYHAGWTAMRNFDKDNFWDWDTQKSGKPGKYRIMVWVRRAGDDGPGEKGVFPDTFVLF